MKRNSRAPEGELYALGKWLLDNVSWALIAWVAKKSWGRISPQRRGAILFLTSSCFLMIGLLLPSIIGMWYLGLSGWVLGVVPFALAMFLRVNSKGRFGRSFFSTAFQYLANRFLYVEPMAQGFGPSRSTRHE